MTPRGVRRGPFPLGRKEGSALLIGCKVRTCRAVFSGSCRRDGCGSTAGFGGRNSSLCTSKGRILNIQLGFGGACIFAEVACEIALECIVAFNKLHFTPYFTLRSCCKWLLLKDIFFPC